MPAIATPSASSWLLEETDFDPGRLAREETVFALANGYAGLRGSLEMAPLTASPGFYVAGVFGGADPRTREIVNLPCWLGLHANMDGFDFDPARGRMLRYKRTLDMRQGLLFTDLTWRDGAKRRWRWQSVRFMHKAMRHIGVLWCALTPLDVSGSIVLRSTIDAYGVKYGSGSGKAHFAGLAPRDRGAKGIAMETEISHTKFRVACATRLVASGGNRTGAQLDDDRVGETCRLEAKKGKPVVFVKYAAFGTSRESKKPETTAARELDRAVRIGAKGLLKSHAKAWAQLWRRQDVEIVGDKTAQNALRFSIFHLTSLGSTDEGVSIGAKGLHGKGYQGRAFWDTEIYLTPFFTFTDPDVARAQLSYRYHLLPDARANAKNVQRKGARFPWTSGDRALEIFGPCGWQEHLMGDIAYAVDQYRDATGDEKWYRARGAQLILETAAYMVSRLEKEGDEYVMRRLCGPDEIHIGVDNNAYTNYLTRWHLQRAVEAMEDLQRAGRWAAVARAAGLSEKAVRSWAGIADKIRVPFDEKKGLHEQFDGFFKLKEGRIDRKRTQLEYTGPVLHSYRPTKVSKQADVAVLYYLFADDFPAAMRKRGYRYYEPRCSHTSTLSRSVTAAQGARAGAAKDAYRLYRESLMTDIGPHAECESGIHAACLGGNWQAAVMGFGGFHLSGGKPEIDPHLPPAWKSLGYKVLVRGKELSVKVTPGAVTLKTNKGKLEVVVGKETVSVGRRGKRVAL